MTAEQIQGELATRTLELYSGAQEPELADLYSDPVLHAILQRDGVQLSKLMDFVSSTQKRLAS